MFWIFNIQIGFLFISVLGEKNLEISMLGRNSNGIILFEFQGVSTKKEENLKWVYPFFSLKFKKNLQKPNATIFYIPIGTTLIIQDKLSENRFLRKISKIKMFSLCLFVSLTLCLSMLFTVCLCLIHSLNAKYTWHFKFQLVSPWLF